MADVTTEVSEVKNIFTSTTVWGLILAGTGVISESGDLLQRLIGNEWADKLIITAGLLIAFIGRLYANKQLTLFRGTPKTEVPTEEA